MSPSISLFPCKQFYDGKILNGENVLGDTYSSNLVLPMEKQYSFINIRGLEYQEYGGSYANKEECEAVIALVEQIANQNKKEVQDWDSHDRLRIITMYQGQVSLLKRLLAKRGYHSVLVATVDSSQGCEADIVIISFVRSNSKRGRHATGFLADDRRINVALTRARHQLICVGNTRTLGEGSEAVQNLVADAKDRDCIIDVNI